MKILTLKQIDELRSIYSKFGKVVTVGQTLSDGITAFEGTKPTVTIYFSKLFKKTKINDMPNTYKKFAVICFEG